jgi:hypothetical protein
LNARFLLASVLVSTVLSWIVTFASYLYYTKPFTVDAEFIYRGWPLCWMTESWSYWSQPPYYHVSFQLVNILIDFVFYAVVFQIPMQLYVYSREVRKHKISG